MVGLWWRYEVDDDSQVEMVVSARVGMKFAFLKCWHDE